MKTQFISGKVVKKGRKWLHIVQNGRNENYPEQLLISELTAELKEGDTFENLKVETEFEKQYKGGYKISHTAISDDLLKQREIDKWWGYVKKSYEEEHYIYNNGVSKLHAIGCHDYDEEIARMTKDVEVSNAISWIRHNFKTDQYIYQSGVDVLRKYGISDYDDEINEMYREISEKKALEESKYICWNDRADYYSRIDNGTIVVRDDVAIRVVRSKYWDSENAGYPWPIYEYKGIDVTDTEEGKKAIREYKERKAKIKAEQEHKKQKETIIEQIKKKITENDVLDRQEVSMPSGDIVFDTIDIYGSGYRIVSDDEYAWYIIKNSMDGDDWSRNHIGAGAYGYKCNLTFVGDLINRLKKLEEKDNGKSGQASGQVNEESGAD